MLDAACVDDCKNDGNNLINDDAAADNGANDDFSGDDLVADDHNAVADGDDGVNDKNAGDDLDCVYACNGEYATVVNYANDEHTVRNDDSGYVDGNNSGDDAVNDLHCYKDNNNSNYVVTYTDEVHVAADDGDDVVDGQFVDVYGIDAVIDGENFNKRTSDDNAGDDYFAAKDYNAYDDHNDHDDDNYEVANYTTADSCDDDYGNNQ